MLNDVTTPVCHIRAKTIALCLNGESSGLILLLKAKSHVVYEFLSSVSSSKGAM